tara:strand:- start:2197 stop:2673 length:477 start_codon:yes stop_codon:yes gene_type:complete
MEDYIFDESKLIFLADYNINYSLHTYSSPINSPISSLISSSSNNILHENTIFKNILYCNENIDFHSNSKSKHNKRNLSVYIIENDVPSKKKRKNKKRPSKKKLSEDIVQQIYLLSPQKSNLKYDIKMIASLYKIKKIAIQNIWNNITYQNYTKHLKKK